MNKLKFSIIIAVYNVEEYVEESIQSVINQTLDFKKNIEIILVDDGSTDNSSKICKEYVEKYPQNIKYIYKKNGGASSARNLGIKNARGEYYNFLDSDDLLHEAALEKVYDFFNKHQEVDMVTLPIVCIEKEQGLYHRYIKFGNKSKVIDLEKSPRHYIFSSAASFYKSTVFENAEFSTNLKMAEDLFFNTKLYLKNHKFGFISPNEAVYYYRKRFSNNSITNKNEYTENWLIDTLEYLYKELLQEANKEHKTLPVFLQYIFVYNIVKRLPNLNYLSKEKLKKFYKICESMLAYVDDSIIMSYNYKNYYLLAMVLMFKNKEYDINNIFHMDSNNNICRNGVIVENIANYSFQISSFEIVDNKLLICGYFNDIIVNEFKIVCCSKDDKKAVAEFKIETASSKVRNKYFPNNKVISQTYFATGEIPLQSDKGNYYIALCINNSIVPLQLKNMYGDNVALINQSYDTEYGEWKIKLNNKSISVKLN